MAFSPTDFWALHVGKLLACNADDGLATGLAGPPEVKRAIRSAIAIFQRLPLEHQTAAAFEKCLTTTFWGTNTPRPPRRPGARPYSTPTSDDCEGLDDQVSSVVTASTVCKLMSRGDRNRFWRKHRIRVPENYGASVGTKWIQMLGALPPQHRRFAINPIESHGRPFVWFTRRREIVDLQHSTDFGLTSPADDIRNHLGLIHHEPNVYRTKLPNYLFVINIPSSAIRKAGHLRPSAIEGLANRRFLVSCSPPGSIWGRSVDLKKLQRGELEGGSERVFLRLQQQILQNGDTVTFDHIGCVTTSPQNTAAADEEFLHLALKGRNINQLISVL